ncbi:MAG: uroporphyrinogen decarboxylase family protein [Clostridiales bacterium]|nr:uroporphyrinogen decarboxylase family protein [Clostridiales bacterium]
MTNRQDFLRALRRQGGGKTPFDLSLCPAHMDYLEEIAGTRDYYEYFGIPLRYVDVRPTEKQTDYTKYYRGLPPEAKPLSWNPEWGVYSTPGSVAHFEEMIHPMRDFTSVSEIEDYPFPDFDADYRWAGMGEQVRDIKQKDFVALAFMEMTIFEICWYMRGMEAFLMDLVADEEFACALMDRVVEIRAASARRYAEAGVDILMLGDDVSTQLDMMMSPALWRRLLKPRLAEICAAARAENPDILLFYHGDGNLTSIIGDLIEAGVDILNPVQPECMDPVKIKEEYGDRLSFWGTIGTQSTMPFGTPADIREKVREMIGTVGRGGGLVLAPTHVIEPDVPWENIEAFVEAAKEYGA